MSFEKLLLTFILGIISVQVHAIDNPAPSGVFENSVCIECHEKDNRQLINDWRNSSHASTLPVTDCVTCHGKLHQHTAETTSHPRVIVSGTRDL